MSRSSRDEEFAVFVLRTHDLNVVTKFGREELEGVLVQRLGGRGHLTESEEHLNE